MKLEHFTKEHGGKKNSNFPTLPISVLRVKIDSRKRTSPAYLEGYEKVKKAIKNRKQIQKTLVGYRGVEDGQEVIYLATGRTNYYAAMELIESGELAVDPAEFMVNVEVKSAKAWNDLDTYAYEIIDQEQTALEPSEIAESIANQYRLAGENVQIVAERLSWPVAKVESYLEIHNLLPGVKAMIDDGRVAVTVAIEQSRKHEGEELLNALTRIIEKKDADPEVAKGKGASPKRVTNADFYRDEIASLPPAERETKLNSQRQDIVEIVNMADTDVYLLKKIAEMCRKDFDRRQKLAAKAEKEAKKAAQTEGSGATNKRSRRGKLSSTQIELPVDAPEVEETTDDSEE